MLFWNYNMAGDPIYDTTTGFSVTRTGAWLSTAEPTCLDTAYYSTRDIWATTTYPSYITYTYTVRKVETKEEKKERSKQENISYQISLFSEFVRLIQVKPVRPSIQLRGVSYNGRGWA